MSSQLQPVDLSHVKIGQVLTIDLPQHETSQAGTAHVMLLNESRAGLAVTLQPSNNSHFLPASSLATFEVEPDAKTLQLTIHYVQACAPVNILQSVYYGPDEQVPTIQRGRR